MMVNFLKGYHIFIRPPYSGSGEDDPYDDSAAAAAAVAGGSAAAVGRSGGGGGGSGGGGGGRAGHGQENEVEFDVLGFLSFAKADLRPFLRVLLRTKAFAAFLASARCAPRVCCGRVFTMVSLQRGRLTRSHAGAGARLHGRGRALPRRPVPGSSENMIASLLCVVYFTAGAPAKQGVLLDGVCAWGVSVLCRLSPSVPLSRLPVR